MGIGGAVIYSLALIGVRTVARAADCLLRGPTVM
jgi:hypothetical protein